MAPASNLFPEPEGVAPTSMKPRELKFLKDHELCRLATASKDGRPHVVPVIYALDGEDIIVAIDYKTKKLKNLRENKKVALVVDEYRPNRGLMVEGASSLPSPPAPAR